jgi:hypothetical protein
MREITDAGMVRGGIDLVAYLQDFWKNEIYHREESRGGPNN